MRIRPNTRTLFLGVVGLFLVTASYLLATIQSDSPEQLISKLQKAASVGDVETFLSGLTRESRRIVEKSYADRALLHQAQSEFQKALDERFGKGTEFLPVAEDDLPIAIGRITAAEIISKKEIADGSVELKLRTTAKTDNEKTANIENTVTALRENGDWKLSLGIPERKLDVASIKEDFERVAEEVRKGRYQDRMAAMIALDNSVMAKEVK